MNPPLRTEPTASRAHRWPARRHARLHRHRPRPAHPDYEKDKEFDYAPNGILGLETALAITLDVLVRQNKFKLPTSST
jgi:dihydroorotase